MRRSHLGAKSENKHENPDEPEAPEAPVAVEEGDKEREARERKARTGALIGRPVHFSLPDHEGPVGAVITGVDPEDENKVNLLVFLPYGHPNGQLMSRKGVCLDDSEDPETHTWHWPGHA